MTILIDERLCAVCGKKFKVKRAWQKFCSTQCRCTHHNNNTVKFPDILGQLNQSDKDVVDEFFRKAEEDPSLLVKLIDKLKGE